MAETESRNSRTTTWLRWIGRGLGALATAWWLLMGIGEIVSPHAPMSLEGVVLAVLMGVAMLGFLIAWWREGIGGGILIGSGITLAIFAYITAGRNRGMAAGVASGPFLLAGVLFLILRGRK